MKTSLILLAVAAALTVATTSGCAVARNQETVGEYVDDTALSTRVRGKFAADPVVSALSIGVETMRGTVQLSGFAKSAQERMQAEKLARETSGVKGVRNDITIRP